MEYKKHKNRKTLHIISSPIIYAMIIPLLFLDITTEIYHNICFRLWGVPLIKRSGFIKTDRQKLKYLTKIDKVDCAYCGYATGLINYVRAILAETEKYWCGIKHAKYENPNSLDYHTDFIGYGDEETYKNFGKHN